MWAFWEVTRSWVYDIHYWICPLMGLELGVMLGSEDWGEEVGHCGDGLESIYPYSSLVPYCFLPAMPLTFSLLP